MKGKRYNIRGFHKNIDDKFAAYIVLSVKKKELQRHIERAIQAGWYTISVVDVEEDF